MVEEEDSEMLLNAFYGVVIVAGILYILRNVINALGFV